MVRSFKQLSRRSTAAHQQFVAPAEQSKSLFDPSLEVASDREVDRFISSEFNVLAPPYFNYQPLRDFLALRHSWRHLSEHASFKRIGRTLLDHIQPSQDEGLSNKENGGLARLPSGESYSAPSPDRQHVERAVLPDEEIFDKLGVVYAGPRPRRTVFFMPNMTPVCATAIAIREEPEYQSSLRRYFQCHVASEIEFVAMQTGHHPGESNNWQRHLNPEYKFVYEFHISYVALREAGAGEDPRGIRDYITMIEPLEAVVGTARDLLCYDAHTSFMIVGRADNDWKAYCNVDTWFGSEQDLETYIAKDLDGPSGGARLASAPCWNPREYFMSVLCQRVRQCGMEWGNVFTVLMARLNTYESHFLQTIDTADLYDDQGLSRTRSYSKAASMLRQYHDTLSTNLDRLQAFLNEHEDIFSKQEDFEDQCGCYYNIIELEVTHLNRWRRRLHQRMQRFESMHDGLLNSSALSESRRSTTQGDNIGLLTMVTVAYLPVGLASSIFGISGSMPPAKMWASWVGASVILGLATICFAFRNRVMMLFSRNHTQVPR